MPDVWVPKATAPEYFSLADAFLALITGDPTWGWLVDWATLIPNSGQNTAEFCAEGPIFTEPLVITDFIPTSNPLDWRQAIHTTALAARLAAAARDRVFGAYCEQPYAGGYTAPVCRTVSAAGRGGSAYPSGMIIPAGASHFRITVTPNPLVSGGSGQGIGVWWHHGGGLVFEGTFGAPGGTGTPFTSTFDTYWGDEIYLYAYGSAADWTGQICFEWDVPSGADPYEPTAQPEPPGVGSPLRAVDPSLDGIAQELARHEFKLDTAWALLQTIAQSTVDLAGPTDAPATVTPGTDIAIGDAVAVVVTCSNVPDPMDVGFGTPQQVAKLGRINFGTPDAWYASQYLTHSPMLIRPIPLGATRITLTGINPTITATMAFIRPNK